MQSCLNSTTSEKSLAHDEFYLFFPKWWLTFKKCMHATCTLKILNIMTIIKPYCSIFGSQNSFNICDHGLCKYLVCVCYWGITHIRASISISSNKILRCGFVNKLEAIQCHFTNSQTVIISEIRNRVNCLYFKSCSGHNLNLVTGDVFLCFCL